MTPLNAAGIRAARDDFPVLKEKVHGGLRLAYLDNAATTQKPSCVIKEECEYYGTCNANVHRSFHYLSEQATLKYEDVRTKTAAFIGAPSPRSIIFTRGTTESINLVASSWGRQHLSDGDVILLSEMEHHSNIIPWQLVARETGAEVRYIPITHDGELDLSTLDAWFTPKVKMLSLVHLSNVLGTVNPVEVMIERARAVGARVMLDAAQSVPHMKVDVAALDCDFLAFSGHKMCAPTGVGVLYGKAELLEQMPPWQGGGEMIDRVYKDHATWAEIPHKFEAGTPHIAGVIGLGAAIDYLQSLGMEHIHAFERDLSDLAEERLRQVDGLRMLGKPKERVGVFSFELEGVHPHDVAQLADREGVAMRAGHLCAQLLMQALGISSVSRASLYFYNNEQDVDQLVSALQKVKRFFQ